VSERWLLPQQPPGSWGPATWSRRADSRWPHRGLETERFAARSNLRTPHAGGDESPPGFMSLTSRAPRAANAGAAIRRPARRAPTSFGAGDRRFALPSVLGTGVSCGARSSRAMGFPSLELKQPVPPSVSYRHAPRPPWPIEARSANPKRQPSEPGRVRRERPDPDRRWPSSCKGQQVALTTYRMFSPIAVGLDW